ncbi:MAG: hypothetical protein HQL82_05655 [Magnetococcales bacterium]|nr:hypothetical protein [Magnetococcales bacterium]
MNGQRWMGRRALGWWFIFLAIGLAGPAVAAPLQDPIQLLEALEKQRVALDERARSLDLKEAELKRLEERIDKRIALLEELRLAIETDLAKEKEINDENIRRLAKIYSGMKPRAAAERIRGLDRKTAIKVLKNINEKVAAQILGKMEARDAAALADILGMTLSDKRNNR